MPIDPDPFEPVRWALVGYGAGGRIFHAPLLTCARGVELVAVVTANADRAAQVDLDLPGVRTVPDLAALADLGVEAVTITTPPATHVPLARQSIELGLAAVVDKPFALEAAEAAALVARARDRAAIVVPYQNRRWDSDYLTATRLVDSGTLGLVHRFTSRIDRFRPVGPGWGGGSPADGAGILLDLGPHLIDQALHLFGPARRVYAELGTVRPDAHAEDDMLVSVQHTSGVHSLLLAGMSTAAPGPRLQISGSAAGFVIDGFDVQEQQLKSGDTPATLGEGWGLEPETAWGRLCTADGSRSVPSERGRWDCFYPAMAGAIRGVGPAPVDPSDAVATASVIDAARESARTHRAVAVADRA